MPLVALAATGFLIACYLTLFQLGVTTGVWEPFFGEGSRTILTSGISRTLPIPDAALGASAYLFDIVSGLVGGRTRWRTMPWMAVTFGVAVGPLGAVSILLVMLQPLVYDAWCTLCLTSAVISVTMIGPAMAELLATLQQIARVGRRGGSRWRAFWALDDHDEPLREQADEPVPTGRVRRTTNRVPTGERDVPMLCAHAASVILGLWLIVSPVVLDYGGAARTNARIAGPLIVALAIISASAVTRPLRRLNLVLATWLLIAPWVLSFTVTARIDSTLVAIALVAVSLVRGQDELAPGGGWRALWQEMPPGPGAV